MFFDIQKKSFLKQPTISMFSFTNPGCSDLLKNSPLIQVYAPILLNVLLLSCLKS